MRSVFRVVYSIISIVAFTMMFLTVSLLPVHAATLSHSMAGASGGGCGSTITNSSNGASASYYTCLGLGGSFGGIDGELTVSFSAHSTPLFTSCLVSMSIIDDATNANVAQQNVSCTSQAKQGLQQQIFHLTLGNGSFNGDHLLYTLGYVNYTYNGHLSYGGDAYSHDFCPGGSC